MVRTWDDDLLYWSGLFFDMMKTRWNGTKSRQRKMEETNMVIGNIALLQ
jgi:hypothetical protein